MKEIKKVTVIGCGVMGRQVALNTALHGYQVRLTDSVLPAVDNAADWAEGYLKKQVEKGRLTKEQAKNAAACFCPVKSLEEAAADTDLVVEAIIEDREIKTELFKKLDLLVAADTILTTNSSFMVSSMFAEAVSHPERLANFHYFNPALVMKLIEVVQGSHTSVETVEVLLDFARKTGKSPVWVRKEIDGFIANRLIRALNNEAMYLLTEGIATYEEIDIAAETGLNHPMGPFRLADLVGLDVAYLAATRVMEETGIKKIGYELLEEKYHKKEFGRKSGKGWYDYSLKP